jgi:three-Cys-motif partner protein
MVVAIAKADCQRCGRKTKAGNCPALLDDGHPVQCVGEWAVESKHAYIRRYIDATWGARRKFLASAGSSPGNGAGFLDLFSGPGRVRVRETGAVREGSPFIALDHTKAPFTHVVLCDLAPENVAALRERTLDHLDRVEVFEGDANEIIDELVARLPSHGLNLALVDPFAVSPLRFETLVRLSRVPRMDILLNFPTSDIRRNLDLYCQDGNDVLDRVFGTREWREIVTAAKDPTPKLAELLVRQLGRLGYTGKLNRSIPVTNSKEGELYRLMLLAKKELADKIWQSVTKNTPSGQRGFGGAGWD